MRMLKVAIFQNGGQAKEGKKRTKRFSNKYLTYTARKKSSKLCDIEVMKVDEANHPEEMKKKERRGKSLL